jgi:hypothetical protein
MPTIEPSPQDQFSESFVPAFVPPVDTASVPVRPMKRAIVVCDEEN